MAYYYADLPLVEMFLIACLVTCYVIFRIRFMRYWFKEHPYKKPKNWSESLDLNRNFANRLGYWKLNAFYEIINWKQRPIKGHMFLRACIWILFLILAYRVYG